MIKENNRIERLLIQYYSGDLAIEQIAEVEAWIESSAENRRVAEQIFYLCFSADALVAKQQVDPAAAFRKVHARIRRQNWRRVLRHFERVAAVMLLPLIVLSAFLITNLRSEFNSMVEIRSTTGMVSAVVLPDSTRVWLNSNSYLRYPTKFTGDMRRVTLYGEAYFDVAHDASKKFIVQAKNSEVEVYGTEFNIEAYDDDYVRTTLVSGRVGMRYDDVNHHRQIVRMEPEQQAVYNTKTGVMYLNNVNVASNISWKEGKIVLDNTPLDAALRMLGNKYNVTFLIRNDELRQSKFTTSFSNQSLEVILKYFTISSNISFTQLDAQSAGRDGVVGRAVFEVK